MTTKKLSILRAMAWPQSVPPSGSTAAESLGGHHDLRLDLDEPRNVGHAEGGEHVEGLLVDVDLLGLDGRHVGDEVHAALALLLLQLQRDPADGALLDALHQVGGEPGDLVPEPLGGDDGDFLQDLLVRVEVQGHAGVVPLDHLAGGLLHGLGADAAHGGGSPVAA
ncbi:hypothetical protein EUGRSUZ_K00772 [Eucalyptus grandis]|uniref:Uncharacterized protein n=2 Tax=Eucalyptus grandis TaxID=71139 RepID=A0ACC3IRU9_EUCGR|nr:hypothetical protein EUGRSUZ_K00772 [Eucalyptus grandis]